MLDFRQGKDVEINCRYHLDSWQWGAWSLCPGMKLIVHLHLAPKVTVRDQHLQFSLRLYDLHSDKSMWKFYISFTNQQNFVCITFLPLRFHITTYWLSSSIASRQYRNRVHCIIHVFDKEWSKLLPSKQIKLHLLQQTSHMDGECRKARREILV